jgi:carbonic anhydrase
MTFTDEVLANNQRYAESFNGPLPLPPSKHLAVVACMDARLNVYGALGLNEGEAHVIRNAGGVVTADEIRSLAISQRLLGTEDVRQSIARIKASPFIPKTDSVRGFVFDVATGRLDEVAVDASPKVIRLEPAKSTTSV